MDEGKGMDGKGKNWKMKKEIEEKNEKGRKREASPTCSSCLKVSFFVGFMWIETEQ